MVHLEKLVMEGFKSYGNKKVEVTFSNSFTTVVGPNGSGKSNIGDAIQFVLGTLSSKSMRASVLQDLIFMGGKARDPASNALVEVYFNNEDEELPVDDDEVVISREIRSDNRSIYRVNGEKTSRKSILDTLMSAGISPEGHNIILQGDVTEIIKMSPMQRRNIIEEVSGIEEYEDKKKEAEKELSSAKENLDKIEFRVSEVGKQVERLEQERNDALRYQHLKEKLEKDKDSLIAGRIEKLKQEVEKAEEEINEYQGKIEKKTEAIKQIRSDIKEKENKIDEIESEIEDNEIVEVERKKERIKGRIDNKKRNIGHINDRIERSKDKKTEEESKIEELKRKKYEKQSEIEEIKKEKNKIQEKIQNKKEKYESLIQELEDLDENVVELRDQLQKIEDKLEKERDRYYEIKDELNEKEIELKETKNSYENLEDKEIPIEEKERELKTTKNDLENLEDRISDLRSQYYDIGDKESKKRKEIKKIKSKLDDKRDKLEEHRRQTRYRKPVREILDVKGDIKGVHGTVGDLIEIKDQKFDIAIETAIGGRLDNIIVENYESAQKCINYLKTNRLGRASFIPLDRITPRPVNYYEDDGVIDLAIDLIDFDPKFRDALEYVLGSTLVVKDLDTAKSIENKRMVTLEGELIEKSGKMVGGSKKSKNKSMINVSSLENEIKELEDKRDSLEEQINDLEDEKIRLREEIAESKAKKENKEEKIEDLKTEIEDLNDQSKKRQMIKENLESSKKELEKDLSKLNSDFEEKERKIEELSDKKEEIKNKIDESESKEIDQKVRNIEEEISGLKDKKREIESELDSHKSKIEMFDNNIEEAREEINSINEKISDLKENRTKEKEELREKEEKLNEIKERQKDVEEKIDKLKDERKDLRKKIEILNQGEQNLQEDLSELKDNLKKKDIGKARKTERIQDLREEHDLEDAEPPEDLEELETKIEDMKKELEDLQPVNMKSIDEYEEIEERYGELKTKKEKLLEEKKSIEKFIQNMEQKKKKVFLEAYNSISSNFSEVFEDLSEGGEAHMSINEEDPLDSDSGLEIEASPAGKEIKRIEAMSGGEKALTALAFIFAIQKYEPAPFYLLDEIDAHLDDKNVERVANMIKNSEESQYIIITLRDAMMSQADKIIGVSMENGISKTFGLDMNEAMDYIEVEEEK